MEHHYSRPAVQSLTAAKQAELKRLMEQTGVAAGELRRWERRSKALDRSEASLRA
jgi:hypothetical protein